MPETVRTDLLIVGMGAAAEMAALYAHDANPDLKILIVTKALKGKGGCSRMVQGGFNVGLNPMDSHEKHFMDTLKGGQYINHQDLAYTLVSMATDTLKEMETKFGCMFDRNPDGTIHQKPFAGQSFDRTVHKGDLTGIEIMSNLRDYIIEEDIRVLQETRGLDLLTSDGQVCGALLLNIRTGRLIAVRSRPTFPATGGAATIYPLPSPPLDTAAYGMAMAF